MGEYDSERLGKLIGMLPPTPEGWVQAAQELPTARRDLDEIVARAEADAEFQRALIADLEATLQAEGYVHTPTVIVQLRRRFS